MIDRRDHDLRIGESFRAKRGFMTNISIVYAGMPNDGVFSLALTTTAGHMGMGYNLYFPVHQRQLSLAGVPVTVRAVSPSEIQLTLG